MFKNEYQKDNPIKTNIWPPPGCCCCKPAASGDIRPVLRTGPSRDSCCRDHPRSHLLGPDGADRTDSRTTPGEWRQYPKQQRRPQPPQPNSAWSRSCRRTGRNRCHRHLRGPPSGSA
uniref:(northern house mosquito) hypothetical protein n=1 Tax=Culex pipiens TaxID=7175 RepID=A0A8D8I9B1_CULPI